MRMPKWKQIQSTNEKTLFLNTHPTPPASKDRYPEIVPTARKRNNHSSQNNPSNPPTLPNPTKPKSN